MTDLENKIYQVIAGDAAGKGLKGAEIAQIIGVDKTTVSSTLYHSGTLKSLVSQDTNYRWHLKESLTPQNGGQGDKSEPKPDVDLNNICNYYLNCLTLESSNSVSQFATSKFELKYAILHGLTVDPEIDKEAIQLLSKINISRSKVAYLGYPVRVVSFRGRTGETYKKIAPIFLFPVTYVGGQVEVSYPPMINMEVLKGYVDNNNDALVVELINLETQLGLNSPDAEVEIDELVLRLIEIRQWDYRETIDPYSISSEPFTDLADNGIYNRAVVIEADRETYTQGLESELMALAKMTTDEYKGTALYAWVKGKSNPVYDREIRPLLEVLPLNSEQTEAVTTALQSDLTIVTGPPGTGKSQVVTDLLINITWNGKSAIFSSKNNKAVDVVDQRVNALSKRPIVLRIGGNQYAYRLAEIMEGLLNSRPNRADQAIVQQYTERYSAKAREIKQITLEKEKTVAARNRLDEAEQEYCAVRELVDEYIDDTCLPEENEILLAAQQFRDAFKASCRENQSFFVWLLWKAFEKKRKALALSAAQKYDVYATKFGLMSAEEAVEEQSIHTMVKKAAAFDHALIIGRAYKNALEQFKKVTPLEVLDKQLVKNKEEMSHIASVLWDKWLVSKAVSFTAKEREDMSAFIAAMELAGEVGLDEQPELKQQFRKMTKKMTKHLQCWAVTSLSAKGRIPFEAGVFDYVIIDEASQCDIASILPLLFRAKHAVIIGDPKQLSHISQISKKQDLELIKKYHVPFNWSYSIKSLYALGESKVDLEKIIQLKDHFRCCADIIEFSNDVFYDGSLRTATKHAELKTPSGEKPGIRWIDVKGKTIRPNSGSAYNSEEAETVVQELKRLLAVGYKGTIGVTTPFRRQAELVESILKNRESKLFDELLKSHEFIADTVHKFQGDERDIMIFSPVVSDGTQSSTLGFLESTGNLFNVAITRARAVLVVVGNHQYCAASEVSYLSKFAIYYTRLSKGECEKRSSAVAPESREYPWVANPEQVSDWERLFYTALYDSGIFTIPQYPEDKYKLDLAIVLDNGRKLDIEVDGEMYHRQWNGELCYRDQLRNQRLYELGWDVKRFWVYQIRDDRNWCIGQVKEWVDSNS